MQKKQLTCEQEAEEYIEQLQTEKKEAEKLLKKRKHEDNNISSAWKDFLQPIMMIVS
jgi:hypothetical protein